jgi:hypothetical protein
VTVVLTPRLSWNWCEFAGREHLADDIAAADELALDMELRNRRPAGVRPAERWVGEHVAPLELDPEWLSTWTTLAASATAVRR